MNSLPKARASIVVSGVIEIIGSIFVALGTGLSFFAFSVLPNADKSAQAIAAVRPVMQGMMLFFLALAILGIFTGVSLIRLKNWARITTLIWAGVMSFFSALVVLVFMFVPIPVAANQPPEMAHFTRIAVFAIYGIPLGMGVWWLILFNKKAIAAQFMPRGAQITEASELPGEAFPSANGLTVVAKPSCPLAVAVVAGFSLLSALSFVFAFFVRTPAILFGHAVHAPTSTAFWVISSGLCLATGIGLLLLKPWSYQLALGLQVLWLCSGTVTMLSGNFENVMRESMAASPMTAGQTFSPEYLHMIRNFSFVGLIIPLLILGVLIYYRARFLEAANSASAA
jgi:hypothetical protein